MAKVYTPALDALVDTALSPDPAGGVAVTVSAEPASSVDAFEVNDRVAERGLATRVTLGDESLTVDDT